MNPIQLTSENANLLISEFQQRMNEARFVVALTGAGISLAAGLPLLDTTIQGIPLKRFFEQGLLDDNPAMYYRIYRHILLSWRSAQPSQAHRALAQSGAWVVTQNIDGLHRDAGTQHVIEMHGNVRELYCPSCGGIQDSVVVLTQRVPVCEGCSEILRPGIVLEGEEVRHYSRAVDWVGRAEILLVIGTELNMSPVCHLEQIAVGNGTTIIRMNEDAETWVPKLLKRT